MTFQRRADEQSLESTPHFALPGFHMAKRD